MSELGAGNGSSYPSGLDTDNTVEVNSPNAGKTKARAEVPNDLAAAIIAIETELGTDPAGTTTDVKTFNQVEHQTDGTHGAITPTTVVASTSMEVDTNSNADLTLDSGTGATEMSSRVFFNHDDEIRWVLGKNDANETGSEVGSDLFVNRYDDDGTVIAGAPFSIIRATGDVVMPLISTDQIDESTGAAGVTIDSVLLKDDTVTAASVITDTISEETGAAGVTVDGVKLKDSEVTTDVINEKTGAAGVTIDSVLLKDGGVAAGAFSEVTAGTDVTVADGTGFLQVGVDGGDNMGIDGSEIQARNGSGAAAGLTLNEDGGTVTVGATLAVDTIGEKTGAAGVTVDGFGIKDNAPNPTSWPCFRAGLSAQQDNITGTDQIEFNTDSGGEYFDTNSDFNTSTFRFVPTAAGKYLLIAVLEWTNITNGDDLVVNIQKNGTAIASQISEAPSTNMVSVIVDANGSTDYFEVFAANTARDTSDMNNQVAGTYFSGSRIA